MNDIEKYAEYRIVETVPELNLLVSEGWELAHHASAADNGYLYQSFLMGKPAPENDLITCCIWITKLYGTDNEQGLKELKEEIVNLRRLLKERKS